MTLDKGTKLGPYEILSLIGEGGMGQVYKARDVRLDRTVAIKILPQQVSANADVKARFEREARALASLSHPHICSVFDVGQQVDTDYLVMEYLEGQTLAQRLEKGPLPVAEALKIAMQVADALDKAHRHGVVHRDLKPGNIMLTQSGAKLLDFGLAKLKQDAGPARGLSTLATIPSMTVEGTILGTVQYMAPEQVEGKVDDIDGRTDIFAFGATVYEMLTGKKAFDGKTPASVMAKILEVDPPPILSLQPMTPPSLDRVVKKCLAKDPEDRWQSVRDLHDELLWITQSGREISKTAPVSTKPSKKGWRRGLPWAAAVVLSVGAGTGAWVLKPPQRQSVSRVAITLPPGQRLASLDQPAIAISPDGKSLVYVALERGTQQLFLRPLDSNDAKPIAGTEGASGPSFSPDGQWLGFFASGKLKKISVNGGAAVTLANAVNPGGVGWSRYETLGFQGITSSSQALQQVNQTGGGPPQPLTHITKIGGYQRWPDFLPESQAVLFANSVTQSFWNNAQILVQRVGTSEQTNLTQGGTQPRYSPTGHLLYTQGGTLMAAPFDTRKLALTAGPVPMLENVLQSATTGAAQYSVSATGTLVYLAGGIAGGQINLVWVSRSGQEQVLPGAPRNYSYPRLSPDGRRVTVSIAEQDAQLWVYDLTRDNPTRFTFEGTVNLNSVWSPDGKQIAFNSNRTGQQSIFRQSADGNGTPEQLTTNDYGPAPSSFSPNGQLLAFMQTAPETARDIWVLSLKDHKPHLFLKTPYEETAPRFSPDGKWIAYSSDETGHREIYVQPYPGTGAKWQISIDGGQEPVWNPRGGELFYRSGSKIMAVDIGARSTFSASKPRMLFEGPYLPTLGSFPFYDVSPDGQRFLMLKPVEAPTNAPTQINLVLNWFEELKQRVPAR